MPSRSWCSVTASGSGSIGANPGVIGTTLQLNGKPATVVGVAADRFQRPELEQPGLVDAAWRRSRISSTGSQLLTSLSGDGVKMWGRMRPGITPAIVEEELRSLVATLRTQHPDRHLGRRDAGELAGRLRQDRRRLSRGTGSPGPDESLPVIAIIGALVLLILAVACANLGGLLLARGVARERELTIRAAVGAGRARLLRQLFTESLLLAFLGSAAGMALAFLLLRSVMLATDAPPWLDPRPDWRVFVFAVGIGVTAAMMFGLAPAWQIVRQRHRATPACARA